MGHQDDLPRRIIQGQSGNVQTTLFEYSADEERLVKRDPVETRYFVTDLYQRVTSTTTGDTVEERFRLYAGSRQIAEIKRTEGIDQTLFFHQDRLGTPETITTDYGDLFRQDFDPFGMQIMGAPSSEATRVGFTGHQHDRELGLVDMMGRIYDPLAARFTSADPVMQAPFSTQGLNRYAYTFNDPVNMVDPNGLASCALGVPCEAYAYGFVTAFAAGTAVGIAATVYNPLQGGAVGAAGGAGGLSSGVGTGAASGGGGSSAVLGGPGGILGSLAGGGARIHDIVTTWYQHPVSVTTSTSLPGGGRAPTGTASPSGMTAVGQNGESGLRCGRGATS